MPKCPKCGSEKVERTGSHNTGVGDPVTWQPEQSDYRCNDCGNVFSDRDLNKNER
jgi:transposase-like protein